MQEQIRVESFVPVLSEHTQFFTIGSGTMGFESPHGTYEHVASEAQPFLNFIDGKRSLEEIIDTASADGKLLSTRALLGLIQKLAAHGCLTQDSEELKRYGFQTPHKERGIGRKLLNFFFNITLAGKSSQNA